jgi:hypothetical protein
MDDTQCFAVNEKLISAIGARQRRYGMKSLCVGLTRLEVVRLKSHGNVIVDKLDFDQ